MSTRFAVALAFAVAMVLPTSAGALVLHPVTGAKWAVHVAPGPGASMWALGDELTLIDHDGTLHTGWPANGSRDTRLAGGPDGSVWLDAIGRPELLRISPGGRLDTFQLPVNPLAAPVDDLDIAPSGVAWATATVQMGRRTRATTYAMRITPDGEVRISPGIPGSTSSVRPPTIAALGNDHAALGVPCGRLQVRTRGRGLALARRRLPCRGPALGRTPLALRRSPDGALWEVLADGRVRRSRQGRTRTVARVSAAQHRLGLTFTGKGARARTWVQTSRRIVEIAPSRTVVHPLPRKLLPTDVDMVASEIAADRDGGLWIVTDVGLRRVDLTRCAVRGVVGLPTTTAATALRDAGCRVRLHVRPGPRSGPLRITSQSIPAGTAVPAGTTVVLSARHASPRCFVEPLRASVVRRSARWLIASALDGDRSRIRVCDRKTGRWWTAADSYDDDTWFSYSVWDLRGGWLLLDRLQPDEVASHEGGEESDSLVLVGIASRTRRTLTTYGSSWWSDGEGGGGESSYGTPFRSPVLDDHGNVAWLEPHAVRVLPHGAKKPRTVDTDPISVFGALRLSGGRVHWTRDGVPASAYI